MGTRKTARAPSGSPPAHGHGARGAERGERADPRGHAGRPVQLALPLAMVARDERLVPLAPLVTAIAPPAATRGGRAPHGADVRGMAPMRRRFGELREALTEGWEIVPPIFARPLWSTVDDSATAFNFVLRGPRGTRLITVPQGRIVERFIRDRQLAVDYAH